MVILDKSLDSLDAESWPSLSKECSLDSREYFENIACYFLEVEDSPGLPAKAISKSRRSIRSSKPVAIVSHFLPLAGGHQQGEQ